METDEVPTTRDLLDEEDTGVQDPELVVHLRDSVADLERQLAEAKQRHINEVAIISELLADAADEHELCSVYDNTVARINQHLTVPLAAREVEVSILAHGTITFEFERRITLRVPMGSAADDPVNQDRVFGIIQSLGVRAMATSLVGDPTIGVTSQTW